MFRNRIHTRLMVAILVASSFISLPVAGIGQKASPVAPKREQVEAIVKEAYDKYRSDTEREECGLHSLSGPG